MGIGENVGENTGSNTGSSGYHPPPVVSSEADYYVRPGGNDSASGVDFANAWASIGKANSTLSAGQTVEIYAGTYSDPIRPALSGSSNSQRITYRAFGDGDVILTSFNPTGSVTEGAIGLGNKSYVTVSGRASGDAAGTRRIIAIPSSYTNSYIVLAGAEGCIVEGIEAGAKLHNNSANTGIDFGASWWSDGGYPYNSLYNIVRDCEIYGGDSTTSGGAVPTEDLLKLSGNTHHCLFEDSVFDNANHSVLYVDTAHDSNSCVVRNNTIRNDIHSALSLFSATCINFLVESSYMSASGETSNTGNAGPGNAYQWGSQEHILRHSVFTEGCGSGCPAGPLGGSAGSTGSGTVASYSRFYHNSVVNNAGSGFALEWFPSGGVSWGDNVYVNNVVYDANNPSAGGDLAYYSSQVGWPTPVPINDKWISNIFGNPGGSASEVIIQVYVTSYNLANAKALANPNNPEFTDWNGFSNTYEATPGFTDYSGKDYTIQSSTPMHQSGSPLTQVVSITNGTDFVVDDSRFFYGEAGEFPSWMGIEWDTIAVGTSATDVTAATKMQITGVDDSTNTISVASTSGISANDYVWLYKDSAGNVLISGSQPNIGADEGVAI